jgi:hypothetical protein
MLLFLNCLIEVLIVMLPIIGVVWVVMWCYWNDHIILLFAMLILIMTFGVYFGEIGLIK